MQHNKHWMHGICILLHGSLLVFSEHLSIISNRNPIDLSIFHAHIAMLFIIIAEYCMFLSDLYLLWSDDTIPTKDSYFSLSFSVSEGKAAEKYWCFLGFFSVTGCMVLSMCGLTQYTICFPWNVQANLSYSQFY